MSNSVSLALSPFLSTQARLVRCNPGWTLLAAGGLASFDKASLGQSSLTATAESLDLDKRQAAGDILDELLGGLGVRQSLLDLGLDGLGQVEGQLGLLGDPIVGVGSGLFSARLSLASPVLGVGSGLGSTRLGVGNGLASARLGLGCGCLVLAGALLRALDRLHAVGDPGLRDVDLLHGMLVLGLDQLCVGIVSESVGDEGRQG